MSKLIGYVEQFGSTFTVKLDSADGYVPAAAMQKLAAYDDSGNRIDMWARLIAVEQPLFQDEESRCV